jgi:hypothetical protein
MTIENIGETYLDINATVSKQRDVMSLIEDEVTRALIFSLPPKSLISTHVQIVSKHPHLFAGKNNEASLFFALRIVAQQHRRVRMRFLKRRQRMGRKLAKNLMEIQQSKEFLDLVSKLLKNKNLQRANSRGYFNYIDAQ